MERPQLSKSERKNMDTCLRRLKQELLSMKEAGDGLHAQMNSMMGALQELKLLQVQTALEQLDLSGRLAPAPPFSSPAAAETRGPSPGPQTPATRPAPPPLLRTASHEEQQNRGGRSRVRSSLGTSPSSSSLESESLPPTCSPPLRRVSGYTAPQADFCGPRLSLPPSEEQQQQRPRQTPTRPADLPGILYSLSREGPSLDSDYSSAGAAGEDDSSDWTSSLMSRSRNRQPLVLGDNVFADLVGNWLDLPELEREDGEEEEEERGEEGEAEEAEPAAHPLRRLSRSQEICRKFSLTTNIFKKFLRGVRPDRDKLLKERPGWMAPEQQADGDLFKRPRKAAPPSKTKGSFYRPFWAGGGAGVGGGGGQQGKSRPRPQQPAARPESRPRPPFSGIYIDRRQTEAAGERAQPLFDYNTAVWV